MLLVNGVGLQILNDNAVGLEMKSSLHVSLQWYACRSHHLQNARNEPCLSLDYCSQFILYSQSSATVACFLLSAGGDKSSCRDIHIGGRRQTHPRQALDARSCCLIVISGLVRRMHSKTPYLIIAINLTIVFEH